MRPAWRRAGAPHDAGDAELGRLLAVVTAQLRAGRTAAEAWAAAGVRCTAEGLPDGGRVGPVVVAACRLSAELGAPSADLLDACARSLERERAAEVARRAALAAPRATARLLLALPAGGPVLAAALGVDPLGGLTGASGVVLAFAGVSLLLTGHLWVRREVRAAVDAGRAP